MASIIENLTDYEKIFMVALVRSEYGTDGDGDGTWEWSVAPPSIPKTSRPGVIGSLCKKGIISSEEYEKNEFVIYIRDTDEAKEVQAHFVAERNKVPEWWKQDS